MMIDTATLTRVSLREEEDEAPWAQKRTVANNDASKEISMVRGRNGGLAACWLIATSLFASDHRKLFVDYYLGI